MNETLTFFLYGLAALLFLIIFFKSFVLVGGKEIAIVERKYIGKGMPQGRVIAIRNEVGIQAHTFGHWSSFADTVYLFGKEISFFYYF